MQVSDFEKEKWNQYEKELNEIGTEVIYFPYTTKTSSTLLTKILNDRVSKNEKEEIKN